MALTDTRRDQLHRRAVRLEWFTISWNVVEAVVAIAAGIVAGSIALVGFGFDSLIEVASASALVWRLWRAGPNAQEQEHGFAERRALYVVAATFFVLAAYILYEAVTAFVNRAQPESSTIGLFLSIASLGIMPALAYAKQKTGQELGSRALRADAIETWVCAYLSLALLLGLGLNSLFGWWWADPVGALLMLPVILWQGWETLEEAREEREQHDGD